MKCPNCKIDLIELSEEALCVRCGYSSNSKTKEKPEDACALSKIRQLQINRLAAQKMYSALHKKYNNNISEGMQYFLDRGLTEKTIARFGLGWGTARLAFSLKAQGVSEEEMLLSGLIGKSKSEMLYDKFYGRVVFPIYDVNNIVIGFGGRILDQSKSSAKYVNSRESEAFKKRENLFALNFAKNSQYDYFILCEGFMDVIALHQAGFTNAIASLGTALTEEQANLLKQFKDISSTSSVKL
jgi:DNA primase